MADEHEIVYKAVADFTEVRNQARLMQAELKKAADEARASSAAQVSGSDAASSASRKNAESVTAQAKAMQAAKTAAQEYQKITRGGSSSDAAHIADISREKDAEALLQRARNRGFSTPQSAWSFRQTEISQQRQMNYAAWGGAATHQQYVQGLSQERQEMSRLNTAWGDRAAKIRDNAQAVTQHANAAGKTTFSTGQIATGAAAKASVSDTAKIAAAVTSAPSTAKIGADTSSGKAAVEDFRSSTQKALDEIARHAGSSSKQGSDSFASHWRNASVIMAGIFSDAKRGAEDAANSAVQDAGKITTTFAAIRGAASGASGGGGAGLGSLVGELGGSLDSVFSGLASKATLITGAVTALIQVLPALAAGLGAVIAAAAALPDIFAAGATGMAVFVQAVQPVVAALQAYIKYASAASFAQSGSPAAAQQVAATQHQVADAYFNVQQAAVTGANAQVVAAHAVRDAQFALGQAVFSAGIQQKETALSVSGALHGLQDSQFAVTQAQYSLNTAWVQAQRSLQDLETQVGLASLNLRGAQLSLQQAQQNYAQVMASSTSTALDRAQAAYQIQQAEASLRQVTVQNTRNQQDLNRERKVGIDQYYGVTQAQHALTDAQYAEITAQKQLVIIQRQAANSQVVAAHEIADAVFSLRQAYFSQAQAAVTSSHQASDAQFALLQALYQSKFGTQEAASAWQSYAETIATSINAPAAMRAIELLKPLVGWWENLASAQQGFWSQVDRELPRTTRQWTTLLTPVSHLLGQAATAMGRVVADALKWLERFIKSPAFRNIFSPDNAKILYSLGEAALVFAQALTKIAIAAAPFAVWLSQKIEAFAKDFLQWADSASKAGSPFLIFLNAAKIILPQIAQVLEAVVRGFLTLAGVGGGDQRRNLADFSLLLTALSQQVLPNLFKALEALANPALFHALVALLVALSQLVLVLAKSGGIQAFAGFLAVMVKGLVLVSGALRHMGFLTGVLFAALLALTGLKVVSWVAGIAEGFGKATRAVVGFLTKIGILRAATEEQTAAATENAAANTAVAGSEDAAAASATADAAAQARLDSAEAAGAGAGAADAAAQGALGATETGAGAAGAAGAAEGAAGAAGAAEGAAGGTAGAAGAGGAALGGLGAAGAAAAAGILAAAAAGVTLGLVLRKYEVDTTQVAVDRLEAHTRAMGYNTQGYARAAEGLRAWNARLQDTQRTQVAVGQAAGHMAYVQGQVTSALRANEQMAANLGPRLTEVETRFGLTAVQAEELASRAGVSATALGATGTAGQAAVSKVLSFGSAVSTAGYDTNALAVQLDPVIASLQGLSDGLLQGQSDVLSFQVAQAQATQAVQQNGGALTGNTLAAEQNRQTLLQLTQQAVQLAIEQATTGKNVHAATGTIQDQIKYLQSAQGNTNTFAREIKALREEEAKLRDVHANIAVTGTGKWSLSGLPHFPGGGPGPRGTGASGTGTGMEEGGYVSPDYGGTPGVDSVRAMLMPEEYVHRASAVRQYGVDAMDAVNDGRAVVMYRDGGPVGSPVGVAAGMAAGMAAGGPVSTPVRTRYPAWAPAGTVPGLAAYLGQSVRLSATALGEAAALRGSAAGPVQGPPVTGGLPGGGGTPAANMRLGQFMAAHYGWNTGLEWGNLAALWERESGWSNLAYNRNGGATGIPQSLPYSKMPRAAWLPFQGGQASAPAQIAWGLSYIRGRWRDPVGAYSGYGQGSVTGAAYDARGDWYATGGLVGGGSGGGRTGTWAQARARLHSRQMATEDAVRDFLTARKGKGWAAHKGTGLQSGKIVGIPEGLRDSRKKVARMLGIEIPAYGVVDSDAASGAAVLRPDESALAASLLHLGAAFGPDAEKYLPDHARAAKGEVTRERHALESAVSTWRHAMVPEGDLDDAQRWARYAALSEQAGAAEERAARPLDSLSFARLAHRNPALAKVLTRVRDVLRKAQASFAHALSRLDFRRAPSRIPAGAWKALESAERQLREIAGGGRHAGGGGSGGGSGGGLDLHRAPLPGAGPRPGAGFSGPGFSPPPVGGRYDPGHTAKGTPPRGGRWDGPAYREFRKEEHDRVARLSGSLADFGRYEHRAHAVWRKMQVAQHAGPPAPGIGSAPPVSNAPKPADVWSLIGGGPSAGSYGNVPGFARGGVVPAHMVGFARPMASGGLAGHLPPPRVLSAAAAASGARMSMGAGGGGVSIGHMEINNPVPEKAGESVTRAVQRSAFLAGRGPV